jgi:hypothetical protein
MIKIFLWCLVICSIFNIPVQGQETEKKMPEIGPKDLLFETFVVEPIEVVNISMWVPADKIGPEINRTCNKKRYQQYQCQLATVINHNKTKTCPVRLARLLAEYIGREYKETIPLTFTLGWKWDFSFSLSQYEGCEYYLPRWGGSWENAVEAILSLTIGSVEGKWLKINSISASSASTSKIESDIEIKTFSSMRTRNGYPKERQLPRFPQD